jgi:uncharacterized protein YukE
VTPARDSDGGPYHLDVDPDALAAAGRKWAELAHQLDGQASEITGTPAGIPATAWAGKARTAICAEMTALGGQTTRFAEQLRTGATTLTHLASTCQDAQTEVAGLNRAWHSMQDTYTGQLQTLQAHQTQAEQTALTPGMDPRTRKLTRQDLHDTYAQARGDAAADRDRAAARLDGDFQGLVDRLRARFRQACHALAAATVAPVPDTVVSGFVTGGGTGSLPSWCTRDGGIFPPDLHAEDALGGAHLARDHRQWQDGQAAAERFNSFFATGPRAPGEIEAFLASLEPGSAAFRQGFLTWVDPNTLLFAQRAAHSGVDQATSREYGKVITVMGRMMAAGSNTGLQGAYPVPSSFYQHWVDVYEHTMPPVVGYLAMAELVQAGQGDQATWDSNLLVTLTRDTIGFEQAQGKADATFRWYDGLSHGWLPTDAEQHLTTIPGRVDATAMMLDATSKDETAARELFTTGQHTADTALPHYLYDGRRNLMGDALQYGTVLGNTLQAATTTTGSGGPGTPEYISAEIVSDVVNYYGSPDHGLLPGMQQPIVGMLCHHIQDVNAATTGSDARWTGVVHSGELHGILARQRLTVAVLDQGDVKDLLTEAFGVDYFSANGSRPLFQQFTTVQTAALKANFLTAATAEDPRLRAGRMQAIAGQHGAATRLASDCLHGALLAHGMQADQANAEARAAASWVVGMVTGGRVDAMNTAVEAAVPGIPGKVAVFVAGKAVDGMTTWAINQVIPATDHVGEMRIVSAEQESRLATTNSLAHLSWLDEAGQLGPAAPDAWAAAHPGKTGFLRKGADGHWHFADLAVLRDQANTDRYTTNQAWNDFTDYWSDVGSPQLRQTDLYENCGLGLVLE